MTDYKRTKKLINALVTNDFPQCLYCTKIEHGDRFGGGYCQCMHDGISCAFGKENHFAVSDAGLERLIKQINQAVCDDEINSREYFPFGENYKCDKKRRLENKDE